MYRIVILFSVFLFSVTGMLFLQGGKTRNPAELAAAATPDIAPDIALDAVSDLSAPATARVEAERSTGALALAAADAAVQASEPAPAVMPAPPSAPVAATAPVAAVPAGDVTMRALTDGVLAELGIAPAQGAEDPEMATATARVLAGLQGGPIQAKAAGGDDLVGIVAQALQQGQSDAYIDQLVNEAVSSGRAVAPSALRTSDGRVDTAILLSELVRAATGEDPTGADPKAVGGAGVEVRTVQEAGETKQYHFYTVQSGDSLGAIAHRFYGDAALYPQIFEANRRILSSPNEIRSGQRLTIPALPA